MLHIPVSVTVAMPGVQSQSMVHVAAAKIAHHLVARGTYQPRRIANSNRNASINYTGQSLLGVATGNDVCV